MEYTRSRGFSLIEVMLACSIMTGGMLGIIRLQATALAQVQASQQLLQADWLVQDLLARIQGNPSGFRVITVPAMAGIAESGASFNTLSCAAPEGCAPEQLAAKDLLAWFERVHGTLPGAEVVFEEQTTTTMAGAYRLWQLELRWQSPLPHSDANTSHGRFLL